MQLIKTIVTYLLIYSLLIISCSAQKDNLKLPITKVRIVPIYKDKIKVTYSENKQNPFWGYNLPIEIALVKYDKSGLYEKSQQIYDSIFNKMVNEENIHHKFIIYPSQAIESNLNIMNLRSFDPSDIDHLKKIHTELNIKFIAYAVIKNSTDSTLKIIVRNTESGQVLIEHECIQSDNSTAIDDAVKLLLQNKVPVYTTDRIIDGYSDEEYIVYENIQSNRDKNVETTAKIIGYALLAGIVVLVAWGISVGLNKQ